MAHRVYRALLTTLFVSGHSFWGTLALADSTHAECGLSASATQRPEITSHCIFSQRQGYISIRVDDGSTYYFEPVGDLPGNFLNRDGQAIYRRSGLSQEGQLFKLPQRYLYVLWSGSQLECDHHDMASESGCRLSYNALNFDLYMTQTNSSLSQLRLQPLGLAIDNQALNAELDGMPYRAEVADLDSNGWPEVYVYVSSAGSGSYGSLAAWASNNGKSLSQIFLPPLEESPEVLIGYQGHDQFSVVENALVRRFPLYLEGDTNAAPSGGTRQLQYTLKPGEAGWLLVLDRTVDY